MVDAGTASQVQRAARRRYYDDLDAALNDYRSHSRHRARAQAIAATVDYEHIWIPPSNGYIALAHNGRVVVWLYRNFADVWTRAGVRREFFEDGP